MAASFIMQLCFYDAKMNNKPHEYTYSDAHISLLLC